MADQSIIRITKVSWLLQSGMASQGSVANEVLSAQELSDIQKSSDLCAWLLRLIVVCISLMWTANCCQRSPLHAEMLTFAM